jgi:hypothetical protein
MAQPVNPDKQANKAKLLYEFQRILADQRSRSSRVATKEEEAERERSRGVLEAVSQYTADGIVRGLADLQLDFGGIISGFSTRLTTETNKLDDLRRANKRKSWQWERLVTLAIALVRATKQRLNR